jgi:4a-hydroxytetrahydrobiopterin dehydratase
MSRPSRQRPPGGILAFVTEPDIDAPVSRTAASEAVSDIGWRYLLGMLVVSVPVRSLAQASEVAAAVVAASGGDADGHLRMDLRPDRVELSVQARALSEVTGRDIRLARRIAGTGERLGARPGAGNLRRVTAAGAVA